MAEAGKAGSESLDELVNQALDSKEQAKKPKAEKLKPQGLLEKIVLSNWAAPAYAAAYAAVAGSFMNLAGSRFSLEDKVLYAVASPLLGYFAATFLKQDWLLRKAEARYRKLRGRISKVFTAIFDHPEIVAIPSAAVMTGISASLAVSNRPFLEILQHPDLINLNLHLSAYIGLMYLNVNYALASLALSKFFHPEAIKTVKKAASAMVNAYKARYGEAAQDLAELLEAPMDYTTAVSLQEVRADMQVLSNDPAAAETYISALATPKTQSDGRSDMALSFLLWVTSKIAKKAKKPDWAESEEMKKIIAATNALSTGKLGKANEILLSAVTEHRDSLKVHVARASFLRATGQDRTADLEMKVCGDLVMRDPNAKLERVEGRNRNIVYFSENVAMKHSRDRTQLDGEREILQMFRERHGNSAALTLPVYKRGDFYVLLSEKGPTTLQDLIIQKKARLEDFLQASELTVQFQQTGLALYRAGKLNLADPIRLFKHSDRKTWYFSQRRLQAIENIERFNNVKMPRSYKDRLGFGLVPVDRELANSQLLTMCSDRGPKNILKMPFGIMQFIDFEPQSLRLLPPQMDFINLTESLPYLTHEQLLWLQDIHFQLQKKAFGMHIDKKKFKVEQAFSGLQWHHERLIYSTREAYEAKTHGQLEEKKKDQVWHLMRARECLDEIIDASYFSGDHQQAVLSAREELERPIFPDAEEQARLEELVEEERRNSLEQEPSRLGIGRTAIAAAGIPLFITTSILGATAIRNNFIPVAGIPLIRQGEKVLLAAQESNGIKYHVINAETDQVSFVTEADDLGATMSAFSDKAVFLKQGRVTLYDFVKGEFRTAQSGNLASPVISPDGFWILAEEKTQKEGKYASRLHRMRSSDMRAFAIVGFPDNIVPKYRQTFSPDGRYMALFYGNNSQATPNDSGTGILVMDTLEQRLFDGPWVSEHKNPAAAWLDNKTLAYTGEDGSEIYLAEFSPERRSPSPGVWKSKRVYEAGKRMPAGYEQETIEDLKPVGNSHLAFVSRFSSAAKQQARLAASILDLKSGRIVSLDGSAILDASGSRMLYVCNVPSDLCEFDTETRLSRNLTNTRNLAETLAVYARGGKKVYAAAQPAGSNTGMGAPSLIVLNLANGNSEVLKEGENAALSYSLRAPRRD